MVTAEQFSVLKKKTSGVGLEFGFKEKNVRVV